MLALGHVTAAFVSVVLCCHNQHQMAGNPPIPHLIAGEVNWSTPGHRASSVALACSRAPPEDLVKLPVVPAGNSATTAVSNFCYESCRILKTNALRSSRHHHPRRAGNGCAARPDFPPLSRWLFTRA